LDESSQNQTQGSIRALYPELSHLLYTEVSELRDTIGLEITLRDGDRNLATVMFARYYHYARTHESWALDTITYMIDRVGRRLNWLYELTESPLLSAFIKLNPQMPIEWQPRHLMVVTGEDTIDVISSDLPTVEVFKA
jgi:hypothetical protein